MKSIVRNSLIVGTMLVAGALFAFADGLRDLPVMQVGGKDCYYYEVKPKETVYSLCKRFGVTREEFMALNPSAADGLKAGQMLYFPVDKTADTGRPHTYVVEKSETAYGISKKFGMTTDEFYALNPEALDGLKAGQIVKLSAGSEPATASESAVPSTSNNGNTPGMHEIAAHETLFQIANEHNTTVAAILAANPGLDERYYRAGQIIKIPEGTDAGSSVGKVENTVPVRSEVEETVQPVTTIPVTPATQTPPSVPSTPGVGGTTTYKVQDYDTFYGIAGKYGVTVADLQRANPNVDVLREGMTIVIPVQSVAPSFAGTVSETAGVSEANEVSPDAIATQSDTLTIALALPFMLKDENRSRQARLYTEFYKGFLIAVDSMRNMGTPIRILTYDTEGTLAGVNCILATPELKKAKMIVAPDNQDHLGLFGNFGALHGIDIINLFVVRDQTYNDNSRMMQANIPHEMMYGKAIDYLMKNFGDYTPVIVTREDGPTDKIEFTRNLAKIARGSGREVLEITFSGNMSEKDFAALARGRKYAFIPVTSKQAELNRMLPALSHFKEKAGADDVMLWGYPEWTTFRGETLDGMHQVNTYVFSRFYTAPEDYESQRIDDQFARWYGARMAQFVPRQGLLGFDTGMYLLTTLNANDGNFAVTTPDYTGVQNGFSFLRMPRGGLVNNRLYFLNYRPGTTAVGKITL